MTAPGRAPAIADLPATDLPAADLPAADLPAADLSAADLPAADLPAAGVLGRFSAQSRVDRVFLSAVHPPAAGLIRFGGGLPDPATYPRETLAALLDEVVREGPVDLLSYDLGGEPALRDAIARRMRERGAGDLGPQQVMATHGSAGAISLAARALLDPGDVVLAEELSYPGSLRAFELAGAEVVRVPIDRHGLLVDDLVATVARLRAAGRDVKGVYTIATFHNPTGVVLAEERRVQLAEAARRLDLVLLQDDTYGELDFDALRPTPLIALAPERTIHLGSFSKVIAPGLRVGWAAADRSIVRALSNVRTDLGAPGVVQHVVARFVDEGHLDRHVARVLVDYRAKRDALLAALDDTCAEHCEWDAPGGAFFVWMRPRRPLDVVRLGRAALEEGATFLDASYFRAPDPDAGFRLAYGELRLDELTEGAHRIGRALARTVGAPRPAADRR